MPEMRPTEEIKNIFQKGDREDYEGVFDDVAELVKYLGGKARALHVVMQAYEYDMQILKSEIHDLRADVDRLKEKRKV